MAAREASLEDALAQGADLPAVAPPGDRRRVVDLGEGGEELLAAALAARGAGGAPGAPGGAESVASEAASRGAAELKDTEGALQTARREYEEENDAREKARERDRQKREAAAREEEERLRRDLEHAQQRLEEEARARQEHLEAELAEQQLLLQEEEAEARRLQAEVAETAGASRAKFEAMVAEQEREGAERRERAERRREEERARLEVEARRRAASCRISRAWLNYRKGGLCARRHAAATAVQAVARGALARSRVSRLRAEGALLGGVREAEERRSRSAIVTAVAAARRGGLEASVVGRVEAFDSRARAAVRTLGDAARKGSAQVFEAALAAAQRYDHLAEDCEDAVETFRARRDRAESLLKEASSTGSYADANAAEVAARSLGAKHALLDASRDTLLSRQAGARDGLVRFLEADAVFDLAAFAEQCSKASYLGLSGDVSGAERELMRRREAVARRLAKCTEAGSRREVMELCRKARSLGGKAAQQADLAERFLNKRGADALEALQESLRKGHIRSIEVCIAKAEELGVDDRITCSAREQLEKRRAEAIAALNEACKSGSVKAVVQRLALAAELGIESALQGALDILGQRGQQCIDMLTLPARHEAPVERQANEESFQEHCRAAAELELHDVVSVAGKAWDLYGAVTSDRGSWGSPLCSFQSLKTQKGWDASSHCRDNRDAPRIPVKKINVLAEALRISPVIANRIPNPVLLKAARVDWATEVKRKHLEPSGKPRHLGMQKIDGHPPAGGAVPSRRAQPASAGVPLTAELLLMNSTGCGLDGITEIFLSLEGLNSMEAIALCPRLRKVNLNVNSLSKVEGIRGCKDLLELSMKENRLESLEGIAGLHALVQLFVDANSLVNLEGLAELPCLGRLTASENKIRDVGDCLRYCRELEHLDLAGNHIQSTSTLRHCERLRHLCISRNGLEDLEDIASCRQLVHLVASDNKVSGFPSVWCSPFIQTMNLSGNRIESLPPALHMPALRVLLLQDNRISDLGAFGRMGSLELLDLSFNSVQELGELDSLSRCQKLEKLYLNDNPVAALGASYTGAVASVLPHLEELDNERIARDKNILRNLQQSPIRVARLLFQQRMTGYSPLLAFSGPQDSTASSGAAEEQRARLARRLSGPSPATGEVLPRKVKVDCEWEAVTYMLFCRKSRHSAPEEATRSQHLDFCATKYQNVQDGPARYVEALGEAKSRCATLLQSQWRRVLAQRLVQRIRSDRKDYRLQKAATRLQSVFRGRSVRRGANLAGLRRRRLQMLEAERQQAAQAAKLEEERQEIIRDKARVERARHVSAAATRIQAAWRGSIMRSNLTRIRKAARYVDDDDFDYCGVNEDDLLPPEDLMLEFTDDEATEGGDCDNMVRSTLGCSLSREASVPADVSAAEAPLSVRSPPTPPLYDAEGPREPSTRKAASLQDETLDGARGGSPQKPPVPRLGLAPALVQESSQAALSKEAQRMEALASEWGISNPALAEQFLKNQRKHVRQRKQRTKEQKMKDSQVRLKKFRHASEDAPSVSVQHREVRRGVKLPLHCGEVLGPESREGRPFAPAPLQSARSLASEPSEDAPLRALRATRSSDGPAPAVAPLALDAGRGSGFLPEGRVMKDNWCDGIAGQPAAASTRRAPKKSRRFR